ncbi:MAG: hypothetical protein HY784_02065 [Chloroflexi bacterium]|nr:hypothetical protein [Chloroflexota bacterium]
MYRAVSREDGQLIASVPVTLLEVVRAVQSLPVECRKELLDRVIEETDELVLEFVDKEIHLMRAEQRASGGG